MTYKYVNIRFDSKYSVDSDATGLIEFINTFPEVKQTDEVKFENTGNYPWGVISLIQCDKEGNYSLDKGAYFEEINLIELLFSDTEESLKHYLEIATRIAEKMNWEIIDDDTDEVLVYKKNPL